MLPVSLDCPFLISLSVFPNVYLNVLMSCCHMHSDFLKSTSKWLQLTSWRVLLTLVGNRRLFFFTSFSIHIHLPVSCSSRSKRIYIILNDSCLHWLTLNSICFTNIRYNPTLEKIEWTIQRHRK